MAKDENILLGAVLMVLGALVFTAMNTIVKLIGHEVSISTIVFARFALSLVAILPWVLLDRSFQWRLNDPVKLFVRVIAALMALVTLFYVVNYLPLTDASLLISTSPLFVPIITGVLLHTRTPKRVWLSILVGFIGVLLVLHPGKELLSVHALIGLSAGVFSAIALVMVRVLTKTNSVKHLLFYYFFISTIFSGVVTVFDWNPLSMHLLLLLLAIGVLGVLYQVFLTIAFRIAPVRLMSPLMFSTVLFGGVADWYFWQHAPDLPTIIGFVVITLGAIGVLYFGRVMHKSKGDAIRSKKSI